MNINEIVGILTSNKGRNLRAIWGKSLKLRKDAGAVNVEKVTSIVIRGGIDYDNLAIVQEKREDGSLPSDPQSLPWGEWVQFPIHIAHKGTDYARFYPASGINFETKVEYYLDGELTTKEAIQPLCLASEFPKRDEAPLCYSVKAENVKAILI
jgi:hypothetical protein